MGCAVAAGEFVPVSVPEEPFLGEVDPLPPLPPLDPLPVWGAPPAPVAPTLAPAEPAAAVGPVSVDPLPWVEGDAPGVVAAVMATTGALAQSSQANALAAIEQLAQYAAAFTPVPVPVIPTATVQAPALADAPAAPDLTASFASLPLSPADAGAPALDVPAAPLDDSIAPALSDIVLPDPLAVLIPSAPALLDVAAPAEPDFTLPPAPTLVELAVPDAPTIALPVFDAQLASRPTAPSVQLAWDAINYESALLAAMQQRLSGMVLDQQATGVLASVEQGLFERAAAREDLLTLWAAGAVERLLRARGQRVPAATLARVVQQAAQGGLARSASLQRDIAIGRAQLQQQNMRFAIENATALEQRLIDKHNAAQARALEAAKAIVQVQLQLFAADVALYQADVAAFAMQAQVFKARLEAALAQLQVYRAQIEAELLKGEVNTQKVAIYRAQVEGLKAVVETYKARVEAAHQMVEADKSRIDAYGAQVQAFAAQIEAKDAEYQGYAARMQVQGERARLYATQVEAYAGRVRAYDALVKAKTQAQELRFKQANEFPLQLLQARIAAYKSGTQAVAEKLRATAQVYSARVRAFTAGEDAKSEQVAAQIAVVQANAEGAISQAQALIQAGEANLRIAEGAARIAEENVRTAGQLSGQLAAAAVAAQSVHAAIGETGAFQIANHSSDSATNATATSSHNATGVSVSNNDSTTASSGTTHHVSVTNGEGRVYNRGYSNTTSTANAVQNTTTRSAHNSEMREATNNSNSTLSHDCVERTTFSD